jgi:hypothetical protein
MYNNLRVTSCLLCELRVRIICYTKSHEGCTKSHEERNNNRPQGHKKQKEYDTIKQIDMRFQGLKALKSIAQGNALWVLTRTTAKPQRGVITIINQLKMNMMNGICGINRITPFQGLRREAITFRRALPYANDIGLSAHCNSALIRKFYSKLLTARKGIKTDKKYGRNKITI